MVKKVIIGLGVLLLVGFGYFAWMGGDEETGIPSSGVDVNESPTDRAKRLQQEADRLAQSKATSTGRRNSLRVMR